ncbi:hydroxyethylthiazole kinase [Halomonas sp. Bachu 37]|uniref:hydroxyethylthiazole kinase n=1 Tax=Halomonas kashgarensis TaxID=3084920 RepID=UPI003216EA15
MPAPLDLASALEALRRQRPLVHNITNYVAMNSSANLLLAMGASPAMLHAREEVVEFVGLADVLSINLGTPSPAWAEAMLQAAKAAQVQGKPWVLDPVAVGATAYRRQLAATLLDASPTLIRANPSEILALDGMANPGRGVDATDSTANATQAAIRLARHHACLVAVTGEYDLVTDGQRHVLVHGGHELMPTVTTLGCGLSAVAGAFIAASPRDTFNACVAALTSFAVAGSQAAHDARGPASFQVAFIDALYQLTPEQLAAQANVEVTNAL